MRIVSKMSSCNNAEINEEFTKTNNRIWIAHKVQEIATCHNTNNVFYVDKTCLPRHCHKCNLHAQLATYSTFYCLHHYRQYLINNHHTCAVDTYSIVIAVYTNVCH